MVSRLQSGLPRARHHGEASHADLVSCTAAGASCLGGALRSLTRESAANKRARRSAGHEAEPNALAKKRASASTWRPPDGRAFTLEAGPPQAQPHCASPADLDPG